MVQEQLIGCGFHYKNMPIIFYKKYFILSIKYSAQQFYCLHSGTNKGLPYLTLPFHILSYHHKNLVKNWL